MAIIHVRLNNNQCSRIQQSQQQQQQQQQQQCNKYNMVSLRKTSIQHVNMVKQ